MGAQLLEAGKFESVGNLLAIENTLVSDCSSEEESTESVDSLIEILAACYTASIVCLLRSCIHQFTIRLHIKHITKSKV